MADRSSAATPTLREAVEHVVNDSPGTPESVKQYLSRALAASPDREPVSAHLNAIRAWAKDPMVWARIGPAGVGRVLDTVDELEAALASARGETGT